MNKVEVVNGMFDVKCIEDEDASVVERWYIFILVHGKQVYKQTVHRKYSSIELEDVLNKYLRRNGR